MPRTLPSNQRLAAIANNEDTHESYARLVDARAYAGRPHSDEDSIVVAEERQDYLDQLPINSSENDIATSPEGSKVVSAIWKAVKVAAGSFHRRP